MIRTASARVVSGWHRATPSVSVPIHRHLCVPSKEDNPTPPEITITLEDSSEEQKTEEDNVLDVALKPREVVDKLDQFIVGQADAKRAVAIALRNRWRRHRLPEDLRNEVNPKNILMIGPTGESSGKYYSIFH